MLTITSQEELKEAIELLKEEKSLSLLELKENFFLAYDSLKPANLIESTIKEISSSPFLFKNIFTTALGLVAGYVSKKALTFDDSKKKPIKLVGMLLQLGVTNLISYGPDLIKSLFERKRTGQ